MIQLNELPLFRVIEYPDPVETIADNHPEYVNGITLINGKPIITDNKKDSSRIEEFKKIGFSKEYIQWLIGEDNIYRTTSKGQPVKNRNSKLCGTVSYKGITNQNQIHDPDNYETIHRIEIKEYSVYLNDRLIASAPGKKSKSQKEKFCKAVIWALMNDPISLQDKLTEISQPIKPVFPAGYIPYLNLSITEEVCTA